MSYKDIRHFMNVLEKKGLLKRIAVEVDSILEITEIADRVSKQHGPALLFENVKDSNFPVLINAFGSWERMSLALETEKLDDVAERIGDILTPDLPTNLLEKLKVLPKLFDLSGFIPKTVKKGACKEVIIKENPSLDIFPVLQCWPEDGGRFITLPLVFTKDAETGHRNCGMYRMQVYDGTTTGMHWHLHKHGAAHYRTCVRLGQRMEVAVAIGSDPAVTYAATAPLPDTMDEMLFAGFLRKDPVELIKCETIDIYNTFRKFQLKFGFIRFWNLIFVI